jgi:hypothetical protein
MRRSRPRRRLAAADPFLVGRQIVPLVIGAAEPFDVVSAGASGSSRHLPRWRQAAVGQRLPRWFAAGRLVAARLRVVAGLAGLADFAAGRFVAGRFVARLAPLCAAIAARLAVSLVVAAGFFERGADLGVGDPGALAGGSS